MPEQPYRITHIDLGGMDENWIEVHGSATGVVTSNIHFEDWSTEYNAAIDALESLLLALHCAGLDLKQYEGAVQTAFNKIVEEYG